MTSLADSPTSAARLLGTRNAVRSVLAINAAAAATVKTTSALEFQVDGVMYTRAALSATALAALASADFTGGVGLPTGGYFQPSGSTAFYVQPASTTVYYVLVVNAAGTVRVVQGTYTGQPISSQGLTVVGKSVVPDVPDVWVPFGMVKVVTNSSTTFTPATTALDAAGLTVTFYDIGVLPANAAP